MKKKRKKNEKTYTVFYLTFDNALRAAFPIRICFLQEKFVAQSAVTLCPFSSQLFIIRNIAIHRETSREQRQIKLTVMRIVRVYYVIYQMRNRVQRYEFQILLAYFILYLQFWQSPDTFDDAMEMVEISEKMTNNCATTCCGCVVSCCCKTLLTCNDTC